MRIRILTLLSLFMMTSLFVFAENNTIKFMGIPIEGDFDVFCNNLIKKKALIPTFEDPEYVGLVTKQFYGDFWKFEKCKIDVRKIIGDANVSSIAVKTTDPDDIYKLEELLNKYDDLYGPHEVSENMIGYEVNWTFQGGNIYMLCFKQFYEYSIIIVYSNNRAIQFNKSKHNNVDDDL